MINDKKMKIDDLGIFGGPPIFVDKLHVGRPNIGSREKTINRINDILDRRWLTNNGPFVNEFEKRIAEFIGVKHCIAMCNATVALEIAVKALDFKGEVILPSFTFIATANALQWQGITPVFCDIDPTTHNLDPKKVEGMITPRTSGILGVHVWGRGCSIQELTDISSRHKIPLLFDAAHAFGCSYQNQMIGQFGEAEVFSFHATKFFNTLEGGAVVTNNSELAHKIRLMKNFGFTEYDQTSEIGMNGKMNEVSAAVGLTNLESIDEFLAANRRNYLKYKKEISSINGIDLVEYNENEKNNFQYIVATVDEKKTGISRDDFIKIMHAEGVLARRYFYPGCHRLEPYRTLYPHAALILQNTENLSNSVMVLPNGTSVHESDITMLCDIIRFAITHRDEIKKRLH